MKSPLSASTWEQDLFSEKSQSFPSRSTRSSSGIETMTSRFGRQRSKLCEVSGDMNVVCLLSFSLVLELLIFC
ncbi:hypothetical protein N665_0185s0016 [Sinapis alba]|nr:hypothetical protein N665_0185s0016 [Sinapis alba]